ncbi:MAG: capsule assembly Wzi family protein [Calditrichia bacterium]
MISRLATACFIIFLSLTSIHAQETLPPYHWANKAIDYLKVSGLLPELSLIERPFNRQDIAKHLLKVDANTLSVRDRGVLRTLFQEFGIELQLLGRTDNSEWSSLLKQALENLQLSLLPETIAPRLKAGFFTLPSYDYNSEFDNQFNFDTHSQAAIVWQDKLTLYSNLRVFNNPPENYIGKSFSDLYAYNEQSYLHYRHGWFSAKFGRDYFQLGPGRSGQLLFSDNSRPFDMYHLALGNNKVKLSAWGMRLNDRRVVETEFLELGRTANRYINGHRLSFSISDRFYFGLTEAVIYGGPQRGWELALMNPVSVYYAVVENFPGPSFFGNLFYSLDWDLYLTDGVELYGEFMLDDFQINNEDPKDLEPTELAFLAGVNWAPKALPGAKVNLEYVQVRNRTYNTSVNEWEKFLHRGEEIGYFQGNNFNRIGAELSYWLRPDAYIALSASRTSQGEGSVSGSFNTDFLNFTPEEGYSEDFPFGQVETQTSFGVSGFYKPHQRGHLEFKLSYDSFDDFEHVEGSSSSNLTIRTTMWLEWNKLWNFSN